MHPLYFRSRSSKVTHYELVSAATLLASMLLSNAAQAASPTVPIACPAGSNLIAKTTMSTSDTGGYFANDAARLIDNTWDGWAPNIASIATAKVSFASQNLTALQIYTDNNQGKMQWSLDNGVSWNTLTYTTAYDWNTAILPSTSTQNQIMLKRVASLDNAVEINLCGTVAVPPISGCIYDKTSIKQNCLPEQTKLSSSASTFIEPHYPAFPEPANADPAFTAACKTSHDKYWTVAEDGKAYRTWHPAFDSDCPNGFGHEHGDDPRTSKIVQEAGGLDYIGGGYPPFGYAMHSDPSHTNSPHEDHVGHKVFVANDIKMAFGNPPGTNSAPMQGRVNGSLQTVYSDYLVDSGITCQWLSKIHQGTHSPDALFNNAHEYFLNVSCNDQHQGGVSTKFSVKKVAFFGKLNEIKARGNPLTTIPPATPGGYSAPETSLLTQSNAAPYVITTRFGPTNNGFGDERGFVDFDEVKYKSFGAGPTLDRLIHTEIWKSSTNSSVPQIKTLNGGSITFNPYYMVFNPARMLNGSTVNRTVTLCDMQTNPYYPSPKYRNLLNNFCSPLGTGALPSWNSPDSPFDGTVRSLHFKGIDLTNASGAETFCTDSLGQNPVAVNSSGKCPTTSPLKQRANKINNGWQYQANTSVCIKTDNKVGAASTQPCVGANIEGTLTESSLLSYDVSTKVWLGGTRIPRAPTSFLDAVLKQGGTSQPVLGYEYISNHGADKGVHAPN